MQTKRLRLFNRLKKGLEEGIAHERGERALRVTEREKKPVSPCRKAKK